MEASSWSSSTSLSKMKSSSYESVKIWHWFRREGLGSVESVERGVILSVCLSRSLCVGLPVETVEVKPVKVKKMKRFLYSLIYVNNH